MIGMSMIMIEAASFRRDLIGHFGACGCQFGPCAVRHLSVKALEGRHSIKLPMTGLHT
jgi:hypothetical protein